MFVLLEKLHKQASNTCQHQVNKWIVVCLYTRTLCHCQHGLDLKNMAEQKNKFLNDAYI